MFDSHAHYDDIKYDSDREALLDSLEASEKIDGIINAAVDLKSAKKLLELEKGRKKFYTAIGIHPHEAEAAEDGWAERLRELAVAENAVAIGEIGLDYYYDISPRELQRSVFEKQLTLADELGLPVVIHDRDAHADSLAMTEGVKKGAFHSFSGSAESAEILAKRGIMMGFNGIITFKNADKPRRAIKVVPDELLLCETDCPYLAPTPHRGKRNDSFFLKEIIAEMAALRGQSFEHVEKITAENAARLFGIKIC